MNIVEKYVTGLKSAYVENGAEDLWEHFENIKHGATKENIIELQRLFPDIPDALITLLEYVDGTYWREYAGEKIGLYFIGSDIEEYPYYLLSAKEMIDNQNQAVEYYSDYITRAYEEVKVDERITDQISHLKWLHFSDCMNNGGTSQLFIDFTPSAKGKKGQVVRFLHDPDEFKVIADSFAEYLQILISEDYNFIHEDILE